MSMELFQFGDFTLHSGKQSRLKLECDALSDNEWHMLARIALPILPKFKHVIGVPSGGLKWAWVLEHYIQPGADVTLFVDDVWTTGGSMTDYWNRSGRPCWNGLVLFARGPVPDHVTALFTLHKDLQ